MTRPDDARSTCANCDHPLTGPFCAACGQKDLGTRVTLLELLREVVSETFEVEGRLPRTLVSVAVRPGHYLGEFLDGRRRSFASPLRFYLMMLFVSALALGFAGKGLAEQISELTMELDGKDISFTPVGIHVQEPFQPPDLHPPLHHPTDCRPDLDVLPWLPVCEQPRPFVLLYTLVSHPTLSCPLAATGIGGKVMESLSELTEVGGLKRVATAFTKALLQQIPLVVSLVILLHVLVLKLLWWREHTSTHVMTSLVLHTLFLVALTLLVAVPNGWFALLLLAWHQLHVLFGLKRAYRSGWARVVLAYVVSSVLWGWIALLAFALSWYLAVREVTGLYTG